LINDCDQQSLIYGVLGGSLLGAVDKVNSVRYLEGESLEQEFTPEPLGAALGDLQH
jgi:hypothetical protein